MDQLEAPLYVSLVRPILVAGAERRLVVLEGTLAAILLLGVGLNAFTIAATVAICVLLHPLLVRISKRDPEALGVYVRNARYQGYYPRTAAIEGRLLRHQPFNKGLR